MGKIYLKKVSGGDCKDCCVINGRKMCHKKFNKIDSDSIWVCLEENIHYIQVFPEVKK